MTDRPKTLKQLCLKAIGSKRYAGNIAAAAKEARLPPSVWRSGLFVGIKSRDDDPGSPEALTSAISVCTFAEDDFDEYDHYPEDFEDPYGSD
jgi:hypothetical protein